MSVLVTLTDMTILLQKNGTTHTDGISYPEENAHFHIGLCIVNFLRQILSKFSMTTLWIGEAIRVEVRKAVM